MTLTEEQIQSNLKAYEHAMRKQSVDDIDLREDEKELWYAKTFETFHFDVLYRIRPTPKLRPWKPEEVPVGAIVRMKGKNARVLINGAAPSGIAVGQSGNETTESLFAEFEHSTDGGATWKPCGVMEEGE